MIILKSNVVPSLAKGEWGGETKSVGDKHVRKSNKIFKLMRNLASYVVILVSLYLAS